MSEYQSDIYALQVPTNGQDWKRVSDGALVTGDVSIAPCIVTLAGTEAANEVIDLVTIPEGCRVIPHLCKIEAENPGTSLTLQLGDNGGTDGTTADPDRYSGTVDISAGGSFDCLTGSAASLAPFKTDSPTTIQAKVIAASSVTADQVVTVWVAYSALS